jgi:hypothetical protein
MLGGAGIGMPPDRVSVVEGDDAEGPVLLGFPVETAGRQLPRLTVRYGQALRLRPGAPAGFLLKANCPAQPGDGCRIAMAELMINLDMVCEIAHVV